MHLERKPEGDLFGMTGHAPIVSQLSHVLLSATARGCPRAHGRETPGSRHVCITTIACAVVCYGSGMSETVWAAIHRSKALCQKRVSFPTFTCSIRRHAIQCFSVPGEISR